MLQTVASRYTLDMQQPFDFIDDLKALAGTTERTEYERDWTIFAARRERFQVTQIAEAANLSRSQIHRVIRELNSICEDMIANDPNWTIDKIIEQAWAWDMWGEFDTLATAPISND